MKTTTSLFVMVFAGEIKYLVRGYVGLTEGGFWPQQQICKLSDIPLPARYNVRVVSALMRQHKNDFWI